MFDLSLTQQLPTSSLTNPEFLSSFKTCVAIISAPFQLEEENSFDDAIKAHKTAIEVLEQVQKAKGIRKFNRKMYERQAEIHRERKAYLEALGGRYDGRIILKAPNRAAVAKSHSSPIGSSRSSQPLSTLANQCGRPLLEYDVTTDSELIDLGVRSVWYIVKDKATQNTLYAAQGLADIDKPMIETVLRRADGMFPFGEAVHTSILSQGKPGLNFKMRMLRRSAGHNEHEVWEVPTTEAKKKEWSPRTFSVVGRFFVWKNEDGKDGGHISKKWAWEALYETKDATDGSEVVGEKLFWGTVQGSGKAKWKLFMVEGLDLWLREHILASQLSRLLRWTNPPGKDLAGLEKGVAAVGAIGAVSTPAELLG